MTEFCGDWAQELPTNQLLEMQGPNMAIEISMLGADRAFERTSATCIRSGLGKAINLASQRGSWVFMRRGADF